MAELLYADITGKIIGCAFQVHGFLGNGETNQNHRFDRLRDFMDGDASSFPKISVDPIIRLIRDSDNGETNQNHRFYGLMDLTDGDASSLPKNQC